MKAAASMALKPEARPKNRPPDAAPVAGVEVLLGVLLAAVVLEVLAEELLDVLFEVLLEELTALEEELFSSVSFFQPAYSVKSSFKTKELSDFTVHSASVNHPVKV